MKSKRPVIGITLDSASDSEKYKYAAFPWYALRENYVDCVIKAGGIPILIPYALESIDEIINIIDGLIIPGGDEDINPQFYNEKISSNKVKVNDTRASFEIELLKRVLAENIPYLGICNGMQLLNVLCGGTLIQHIPDYIASDINHEQPAPKYVPTHLININPGTILASLAGNNLQTDVNSTHHQAVKDLGHGLIISATAPDGIIEAIESKVHKYAVGVEWHPEYLNSELDFNLFKCLVRVSSIF
jgi:putative glutamine amidotransferase